MTAKRWLPVVVAVALVAAAVLVAWQVRRATAEGVPAVQPLYFSGTLDDGGVPVEGPRDITVRVYAAASGGTAVCTTSAPATTVSGGRFRVALSDTCAAAVHANPDLWIEAEVGGTVLPRTKIGAVPYALEADTASDSAGALDARLAALEAARVEADDAAACPRVVVRDGTRLAYVKDLTTAGVVRCGFGSDEMVKVGGFWIDRYEAAIVADAFWNGGRCDGSGTPYASTGGASPTDDYPPAFPDSGNWSGMPVYACSVAGHVPSRMMTWFQAQQACAASGKRLCTNGEWQAAVAGTYDPGSYNGAAGGACHTGGTAPRASGRAGTLPGASTSCISQWGAEDMIGNLWEWVEDWGQVGRGWMSADGAAATPWPSGYGDGEDQTWNLNGTAWGTAWTQGLPGAAFRGGTWNNETSAGAFAVALFTGPSSWSSTIGFRCCLGR
jgi:formylglycine-generating enzyme required for sulfatase activity